MATKKRKPRKPRSTVVVAMIKRRQKAGPHRDKKKESKRKAGKQRVEDYDAD